MYKSWVPRKGMWATPHDFREATALNGTLKAWQRAIKRKQEPFALQTSS